MQARLMLCRQYLKEVEEKLTELREASVDERIRIAEALSFVQQAAAALREPAEEDRRRV